MTTSSRTVHIKILTTEVRWKNMTVSLKSGNVTLDREAAFHQIRLFSGLSDKELNSLE
jgi:hypothetical protein